MGKLNDAFNKAGLSVLSLASATAKYRSRRNEEGKNRAKLNYSTAATIKKQNNVLTKNQSEPPKSYFDINSVLSHEIDEQKIATKKVLEQLAQERAKTTSFGELAGVEETFKQADAPTEKEVVEAKKPVQRFGELAGVEETPTTEQKYISSEESAYLPIKAENTETKIPVDEDVQGLIKVKQKNALRSAASRKSQIAYRASKGYEKDFRIRDYLPNVEDKELYKAGITKTELNKLSSILAGNGTDEDIQNWFKKHNASDTPIIDMNSLTVSEDTAKEIKRLILDKDINLEEEQSKSSEWYDNFTRETNTYKV